MKKILIVLIIIFLILLFIFGMYKFIIFLNYKNSISNLEKYTFTSDEKIIKEFKYDKKDYIISMYYDSTSSWSHLNILLKVKQDYYILESIKKCDTVEDGGNLYVKNNAIYIHCIGKEGNIDKYLVNNMNIEKETLNFNYKNTPNISQLQIGIDKVDDEHIYLSSPFKIDATIKDDSKVKCSLEDKICSYY